MNKNTPLSFKLFLPGHVDVDLCENLPGFMLGVCSLDGISVRPQTEPLKRQDRQRMLGSPASPRGDTANDWKINFHELRAIHPLEPKE